MISLGTQTIKEMLKASAEKQESTPKTSAKQKKSRARKARRQKSKATGESDSSDSAEEQTTKTTGSKGAKTSSKPRSRSSETVTKTISTNSSLLMPERVESGQTEFDVRHRATLSGVTDIQQSMVTSSPDATTKFGLSQVSTQLSKHLEQTKTSTDYGGRVSRSAAQVLKDLNYTIPRIDPASDIQSSSKDYDTTKDSNGDEKPKVEIDDEGFKIPQGTSHRDKKKLEADDR